MKNSRVTSIRALPPPTVNRVPEAQPPPSCMPMPKMKAPTITEVPTGETKPLTGWPNRLPAASAGSAGISPPHSTLPPSRFASSTYSSTL